MKDIINRNYDSIIKRGLITSSTKPREFISKLYEECEELETSFLTGTNEQKSEELADVILVCLNIAKHYKIDIEKELNNKIEKNYERSKFI